MDLLLRNWRLKVVAVGLAVGMWLAVVYASNPPAIRTVVITHVQVAHLAPGLVLLQRPGGTGGVSLEVAGLAANVNAGQQVQRELALSVDLAGISRAGVYRIPLRVRNTDHQVSVVSAPSQLTVTIDRRITATVTVHSVPAGRPPSGFTASVVEIVPASVRVSGAATLVRRARAVIHPTFTGLKTSLSQPETVSLAGIGQAAATRLVVSPVEVTAVVAITSLQSTRTLPVIVTLAGSGQPPAGTQITGIESFPSTIEASGPAASLNGLNQAATQPIDISTSPVGVTVSVGLVTPAGVTFSPSVVSVAITVAALPVVTPVPTPRATPTPTPTPVIRRRVIPGSPQVTTTPRPTPTPTPTPTPRPLGL